MCIRNCFPNCYLKWLKPVSTISRFSNVEFFLRFQLSLPVASQELKMKINESILALLAFKKKIEVLDGFPMATVIL